MAVNVTSDMVQASKHKDITGKQAPRGAAGDDQASFKKARLCFKPG